MSDLTLPELRTPTEAEHARAAAALGLAVFFASFLVLSLPPYAAFMAIHLRPVENVSEENVGVYAGIITCSFMLGQALALANNTWESMADAYGRRITLTLSLLLCTLLSLAFGLSSSYCMALIWRFLLGFANGILPLAKSLISDSAMGDKALEAKGMVSLSSVTLFGKTNKWCAHTQKMPSSASCDGHVGCVLKPKKVPLEIALLISSPFMVID